MSIGNVADLRPAQDILHVAGSIAEARSMLDSLAVRDIGGICIKGVAVNRIHTYWEDETELCRFAREASAITSGMDFGDFDLRIRKGPNQGKVTVFQDDIGMHFDGFFTEGNDATGQPVTNLRFPLIAQGAYQGASHHITTQGKTTFVMERLSKNQATRLARGHRRVDQSVSSTNKLSHPLRGEAIELEAGDYMVLHSYGVYNRPLYVHGTTRSTKDRRSVTYMPVSRVLRKDAPKSLTRRELVPAQLTEQPGVLRAR